MVSIESTVDHLHDQFFKTAKEAELYTSRMLNTFPDDELKDRLEGFTVMEYDQFNGILIRRFIVDVELK